MGEGDSQKENLFVLLHELGHFKDDFKRIRNNKELLEIYRTEKTEFVNNQTDIEFKDMEYFLRSQRSSRGMLHEIIAETNAFLYGNNNSESVEQRENLLQQHFPQTFAKAAELLLSETH